MITSSPRTVFSVQQTLGPVVEAPALVSPVPFSARYDLDRNTGLISRLGHPLRGLSIAGTIFICPGVQGGVAAGWTFLKLAELGIGVAGLVFGEVNPVMVQGAQAAGVPIAAGVDPAIFAGVSTGDIVRLDPPAQRVVLVQGA
jgi:predicted aconitase with swiveling domain